MAKKRLPNTSAGFDKALQKMQRTGISTRQEAADFAALMLESIKFEIDRLRELPDSPVKSTIIAKYETLERNWKTRVDYTIEHLMDPIEQ